MKNLSRTVAAITGAGLAAAAVTTATWAHSTGGDSHASAAGSGGALDAAHSDPAARIAFETGSGRLVVDWNKELLSIEKTAGAQPATIHPTRSFALLHAAIYDSVVSITHADAPYAFEVVAAPQSRPDVAADVAAHDILSALFPSFGAQIDAMLANQLANIQDGPGKQGGVAVGKRTAMLMLALRADDGSAAASTAFVPGNRPGDYQLTPPKFPQPVFTNWRSVTPWVLNAGDQFRPPAPPALTSQAWAAAINEVASLGQDTSTTRTADQTAIGKFWAPPIWNTWNEITDGQVAGRGSNLEGASHVFANLNLTFADSVIAFYDGKYQYALWRPVTAIRAGTPGNPAVTSTNPNWNPLAVTASDPSYPAAHSTISAAAAAVLTKFFGDDVHLAVSSDAVSGVTRSFDSFQAAANEAALSRIFAGQHTRVDVDAGSNLGRRVAGFVLDQPFASKT